jgi:UDP-N-acetylglucosamine 2-epimerase
MDKRKVNNSFFSICKQNNAVLIILQPAFLNLKERKVQFLSRPLYFLLYYLLRIPKYNRQPYYGNEIKSAYLFLWGKRFNMFPNRKRTFFLGNPTFDSLFQNFQRKRNKKRRVIICTQPVDILFGKKELEMTNQFYRTAIEQNPNLQFIIKVHPRESINNYNNNFERNDYPNVTIVKRENLYELFKKCDVQISLNSYTSFEAAAMGLVIIIINPSNKLDLVDYFQGNIEIRVFKEDEITIALKKAYSEDYWKNFIQKRQVYFEKMLSSTDGQSAKRITKKIKEIIK